MTIMMICYQLSGIDAHRPHLAHSIKSMGSDWCHAMEPTWLVVVDKTVRQVRDELNLHLETGDKLFVVDIGGSAAVWSGFEDEVRAWLAGKLS
jgi:hypothetical protein